jgi:serine/threonine protein kinase/WD40 repeat protein/Flp pilus assembly protein TadD
MNSEKPNPLDDGLGAVMESFLARFRRGERPSLTELAVLQPDLAAQIQELVPALVELEQLAVLTGSAGPASARASFVVDDGPCPERLGDYRILGLIGQGGMGVVYEAEHESLKCRVALKVVRSPFRADPKYLQRFHSEARLAAGLHHSNIVSVFDYGEQDGVCYYAMQFIAGQPLDKILAEVRALRSGSLAKAPRNRSDAPAPPPADVSTELIAQDPYVQVMAALPDPGSSVTPRPFLDPSSLAASAYVRYHREVARIGAQVADALEHAHRRGVLHRDIKPANLLLDALGNVWVTDFGLAKAAEAEALTQSRDLVGTLRYMAPERFRGTSDRASDIYALGATLYEFLTLRPAFAGTDHVRLMASICDTPPVSPRTLDPRVPRDLETIVLKALAKDPKDRFPSAGELASELRRFLEGRPIRSRPVSFPERFWRWCKRDPWLAGANVTAAALTLALAVGATIAAFVYRNQAGSLRIERGRADLAARDARGRAIDAYLAQARAGRFSRRPGQRFDSLEAIRQARDLLRGMPPGAATDARLHALRDTAASALVLPDLKRARTFGHITGKSAGWDIDTAFERYVIADRTGDCVVYRFADDTELYRMKNPGPAQVCIPRFSPDGRFLITRFTDRRIALWNLGPDRAEPIALTGVAVRGCEDYDFSRDGSALMVVSDDGLVLVNTESGRGQTLPCASGAPRKVAFHPDGRQVLVSWERDGKHGLEVRGLGSAAPSASTALPRGAEDIDCSPDGRRAAIACLDNGLFLWQFGQAGGSLERFFESHAGGLSVNFNHRGDLLASSGWDSTLRLWDARTGEPVLKVPVQDCTLRFRSDDAQIGCGASGSRLNTFAVSSGRERAGVRLDTAKREGGGALAVSRDARVIAVRHPGGLQFWDVGRGERLAVVQPLGPAAAHFLLDGALLTYTEHGPATWPLRVETDTWTFGPPTWISSVGVRSGNLAASHDGRFIGITRYNRGANVYFRDQSAKPVSLGPQRDVRGVSISPDGRWVALSNHFGEPPFVVVWERAARRPVATLDVPTSTRSEFSPDGRWLVTSALGSCRLWEVGTWRLARTIDAQIRAATFSPDSTLLAAASYEVVQLHDPATGRLVATLDLPEQSMPVDMGFSGDGRKLVVMDFASGRVLVWDLVLIRTELANLGLDWDAPPFPGGRAPLDSAAAPLPALTLKLDYGTGSGSLDDLAAVVGWTETLAEHPEDMNARHQRGHALSKLGRTEEALADFTAALERSPTDTHLNICRANCLLVLRRDEAALDQLEGLDRGALRSVKNLARHCNQRAWLLVRDRTAPPRAEVAVRFARLAMATEPENADFSNTLGVALYRALRHVEAETNLERSLSQGAGRNDADNLLFLAMVRHRLGRTGAARADFEAAVRWRRAHADLTPTRLRELDAFQAEAEAVLASLPSELPSNVFATGR